MPRTIRLTNGNDKFTQGLRSATVGVKVLGLDGNDTINMNRADDLGGRFSVFSGNGRDVVQSFKEDGSLINLGAGNDVYIGRGFGSFSTELADQVLGGGGNDKFFFETFKSTYEGGTGNDTFHSVGWQNTIRGGAGSDTISYLPRADDFTQGATGVTIDLTEQRVATGSSRVEFLESIENAIGSDRSDLIGGSEGANRIRGAGDIDQIFGFGGADRFVFSKITDAPIVNGAFDTIEDFSRAEGDKVDLSEIDAKTGKGNQAFTFIGLELFHGTKGELRAGDFANGGRLIEGDVDGDGFADFRFVMKGDFSIFQSDFIL